MDELGSRLREAITDWGTIVGFQREIGRYPIRGTSRATIHAYLNDRTAPSPEFLDHAAKILGVQENWLRTGQGPKLRPLEEALPVNKAGNATRHRMREMLLHRVRGLHKLAPLEFDLFVHLLIRYTAGAPDGRGLLSREDGEERLVELARDLVWLLDLPLDPSAWGFDSLPDPRRHHEYLSASIHALSLLLPEQGEGAPLSHHSDSLIPRLRRSEEEPDGDEA